MNVLLLLPAVIYVRYGKVIGEAGNQGCSWKRSLCISMTSISWWRQTPYISFHQERGKMGIPWVLCAFITSTIQVQLDVRTVSCFSLFLVCSPLACVHFQQCHRFAACLYFLLPGQLYSPFNFFLNYYLIFPCLFPQLYLFALNQLMKFCSVCKSVKRRGELDIKKVICDLVCIHLDR